ncbi:MAG: putative unusual protein kinase regulating ubiquinone biosynthesis (AarF/ABC1/UbiB family) [Halioglobus sp.]|jgi:predicted unusual protein kinase regulating ubiquinone biosynthesis (AarF/ABC1/UbiB family)
MTDKKSKIQSGKFRRSLAVSVAGIRAGGALAIDGALQKLRPGAENEHAFESAFAKREARRFVAELGRLKGTYVKIGQMLALLGEHFLPPVLTQALHELESQTEPLPWDSIASDVKTELGDYYHELDIEKHAIAAASLAQVHRATILATDEKICLKIQYPGLAQVIDSDFDTVVRMLLLARWIKSGRELDAWLESMRVQLHFEIDYVREAQMTGQVSELVAESTGERSSLGVSYHVPSLYPRYCGGRILAMEYVDGLIVTRSEVANLSQTRRNALGRAMLELFFYELYQWGVLQTDPNFGNYLIKPGKNSSGDELVLLDFGATISCDDDFLRNLGNTIAAGQTNDSEMLIEGLIGLGCLRHDSSGEARDTFSEFCFRLLEPLRPADQLPVQYLNKQGEYCWGKSRLMRRVGKHAANSAATRHFTTPSREFAMIARKLTGVFTFIAVLNAEFNASDIVQSHIARWREEA